MVDLVMLTDLPNKDEIVSICPIPPTYPVSARHSISYSRDQRPTRGSIQRVVLLAVQQVVLLAAGSSQRSQILASASKWTELLARLTLLGCIKGPSLTWPLRLSRRVDRARSASVQSGVVAVFVALFISAGSNKLLNICQIGSFDGSSPHTSAPCSTPAGC